MGEMLRAGRYRAPGKSLSDRHPSRWDAQETSKMFPRVVGLWGTVHASRNLRLESTFPSKSPDTPPDSKAPLAGLARIGFDPDPIRRLGIPVERRRSICSRHGDTPKPARTQPNNGWNCTGTQEPEQLNAAGKRS